MPRRLPNDQATITRHRSPGALGLARVHRDTAADRDRGQQVLAEISDVFVGLKQQLCDRPLINVYSAREATARIRGMASSRPPRRAGPGLGGRHVQRRQVHAVFDSKIVRVHDEFR